jgi:hypothetical protein
VHFLRNGVFVCACVCVCVCPGSVACLSLTNRIVRWDEVAQRVPKKDNFFCRTKTMRRHPVIGTRTLVIRFPSTLRIYRLLLTLRWYACVLLLILRSLRSQRHVCSYAHATKRSGVLLEKLIILWKPKVYYRAHKNSSLKVVTIFFF